jgi:hypothetical protein
MAITASARRIAREVVTDPRRDYRRGIHSAIESLRRFVEVETDPAGQRALVKAAAALAEVHGTPSR